MAPEGRTQHILQGDETGGGRLSPGAAGKTPFPEEQAGDRLTGCGGVSAGRYGVEGAVVKGVGG